MTTVDVRRAAYSVLAGHDHDCQACRGDVRMHPQHLHDCQVCHPVALEARRQLQARHAGRLSVYEWSRWRIQMFEAGFGRAVATGELDEYR